MTDIHYDDSYDRDEGVVFCFAPPCCRKTSNGPERKEEGSFQKPRVFGEYGCDTPRELIESAANSINMLKPDFLVWTGDTGPHISSQDLDGLTNRENVVLASIQTVSDILHRSLDSDIPVLPALGNYDFHPVSIDPGTDMNGNKSNSVYDAAAAAWQRWLPEDSLTSLRQHGYYEMHLGRGLNGIVLNTQECDLANFYNFALPGPESREEGQMEWLRGALERIQDRDESAVIVGHIPPGVWGGCWGNFTEAYEGIVTEFKQHVAGQVFGHQHSGSFRVMHEYSGSVEGAHMPADVAFVTPSLTPYLDQEPSFRMYTMEEQSIEEGIIDKKGLKVTSIHQYSTNISAQSASNLDWQLTFSLPEVLELTSLNPLMVKQAALRLRDDKSFQSHYQMLEANGKKFMVPSEEAGDSYGCGLYNLKTMEMIECAHKAEEVMMRQYLDQWHTYVLTIQFPFEEIYSHFCDVFYNLTGDETCGNDAPI